MSCDVSGLTQINQVIAEYATTVERKRKLYDAKAYLLMLKAFALLDDPPRNISEPWLEGGQDKVFLTWKMSHTTIKVEFLGEGAYIYTKDTPGGEFVTRRGVLPRSM